MGKSTINYHFQQLCNKLREGTWNVDEQPRNFHHSYDGDMLHFPKNVPRDFHRYPHLRCQSHILVGQRQILLVHLGLFFCFNYMVNMRPSFGWFKSIFVKHAERFWLPSSNLTQPLKMAKFIVDFLVKIVIFPQLCQFTRGYIHIPCSITHDFCWPNPKVRPVFCWPIFGEIFHGRTVCLAPGRISEKPCQYPGGFRVDDFKISWLLL